MPQGVSNPSSDRRARIEGKLRKRLEALHVEVIDETHQHLGHPGAASGGGHFRVLVVSPKFEGLSILDAQRLVYEALADEMGSAIHALSIKTLAWGPSDSPKARD
jgi:BolA protein